MCLATLSRCYTADHFGAVGNGLFRVERALRASEALTDYLGVFVDENGHIVAPCILF